MAPFLAPDLEIRLLAVDGGDVVTVVAEVSAYPESWSGILVDSARDRSGFDWPLSLSVRPRAWKNATGTKPRASGRAGLHASYQSVSFSRPMTWKKSPREKLSSWAVTAS